MHFESFEADDPPYAILSHTWGTDEVLYADMHGRVGRPLGKAGWDKIARGCEQALRDGLSYVWVDTCCIDKSSSAELSEAINSMFRWYQQSEVCYVHLSDVSLARGLDVALRQVADCRWLTRGWTLQELLAPRKLAFYDRLWATLDTTSVLEVVERTTNIPRSILVHDAEIQTLSVAARMSFAASRNTTRVEDQAYCLLGIFNVNMPLIYGEGARSFLRLQEQIIRETGDQSIFAWTDPENGSASELSGLLAGSPAWFVECGRLVSFTDWKNTREMTATTSSVSVRLPFEKREGSDVFHVILNCGHMDPEDGKITPTGLFLFRMPGQEEQFSRLTKRELSSCHINTEGYRTFHVSQRGIKPTFGDVNLASHFDISNLEYDHAKFSLLSMYQRSSYGRASSYGPINLPLLHGHKFPVPTRPMSLGTVMVFRELSTQSLLLMLLGSVRVPSYLHCKVVDGKKTAHLTRLLTSVTADAAWRTLEDQFRNEAELGLVWLTATQYFDVARELISLDIQLGVAGC